ncbi:MAG TPA: amidase [Bryobacteraceae bacterium]|nr:amidase [Bryobacteraceae bacterium]
MEKSPMDGPALTRREAGKLVGAGLAAVSAAAATPEICQMSAVEMARRLRGKQLSARDALAAHLKQIERVNPKVNAIVTLVADQAAERARQADEALARGHALGPLHGMPIAHKDLQPTKGIRTTFGSRIYQDFVPTEDSLLIDRIRRAGAVTLGKTNTPEFGAGSQTFNEVFGATHNPYDLTKTCGGSSGGAAVSLACRMLPLADGSDMGGSLRNPANFCGVVGLRTSPGRVPAWPVGMAWFPLSVEGPMGRSVADVAFFLSAIAGPDPRAPLSLSEPGSVFARPLERSFKGVRVAWWKDLGGIPVDARVKQLVNAQRRVFESLGCIVEEAEPDFTGTDETFKVLRSWAFTLRMSDLVKQHRELVKDSILWEVDRGEKLTAMEVGRAEVRHTELYQRVRQFLERYEYFVLPVSQVPPFDIHQPYVTEIEGVKMGTYVDWMKSCYYISTVGNPALSVPCGFTAEGLPVGIQIVGRHRDDWGLLQMGHAFEQAAGVSRHLPAVAA